MYEFRRLSCCTDILCKLVVLATKQNNGRSASFLDDIVLLVQMNLLLEWLKRDGGVAIKSEVLPYAENGS